MMDKAISNPMEQFLLLSKSAKGAASADLVKQAVEAPGLYVFGELLDLENIKELSSGEHSKYYDLLELFAYGTYNDYITAKDKYPPLNNNQLNKLRHLTIVTLASNRKCLPYSVLLEDLGYKNLRQLEDLLIEVINTGIIAGRLDQKEQHLQVDYTMGRDVREEGVVNLLKTLTDCGDTCAGVLSHIEELVARADEKRQQCSMEAQEVDKEIQKLKSCMKTSAQETDEDLSVDLTSSSDKMASKKGKIKLGIKTSQSSGGFSSPRQPNKH